MILEGIQRSVELTQDPNPVNKKAPAGYRVSSIEFDAQTGQPKADASNAHDALADIMTNPDDSVCPGNCFRPAGLAFDQAGRLWMTSDTTGEIYVLQKTGGDTGTFVMPEGADENGAGRLLGGWGGQAVLYGVVGVVGAWLAVL